MRAEQTGVVVARGIGLGLVILGACSGAGNAWFEPFSSSGWTSYSPMGNTSSTVIHDVSYVALASLWLPCIAQLMFGSALILFSRPVGRWLAHGLKDDEKE